MSLNAKIVHGELDREAFRIIDSAPFDFGSALKVLRRGFTVARASWANPGKYVMLQSGEEMVDPGTGEIARLKEHLVWKNVEGEFVPWTPSQEAVLARDWFVGKSCEFSADSVPRESRPAV